MRITRHGSALLKLATPLLIGAGLIITTTIPAYGNQLLQRSLSISNGSPGAATQYKLAFTIGTASTLGSIRLQFCANNPIIDFSCTPPSGFDARAAVLTAQSGETGFSKSSLSTANVLILSRVPTAAQTVPSQYEFSGITNPTSSGSYYARLETFASTDATGPSTDQGGLALSITHLLSINAEVPPYLTMCAAIVVDALDCSAAHGDYVNFGQLNSARPAFGSSQLVVATNAANGYELLFSGSTLASGNNTINALTQPDISRPGRAQFGINLRANSRPAIGANASGPGNGLPAASYNTPDRYLFNSGDTIAGTAAPDDFRKYTVSYVVNVPVNQPSGVYVTTITYIAIGNF